MASAAVGFGDMSGLPAQAAGDMPAHLDSDLEAVSLLAMSAGLGTSVLAGQSSVERAQAVIDDHLYRLYPASRLA